MVYISNGNRKLTLLFLILVFPEQNRISYSVRFSFQTSVWKQSAGFIFWWLFFQIDIRGDPFGLLAAHPVAPLISLHHIDAVSPMFPNQTHLDSLKYLFHAYRVDPARILQQSFCYEATRNWSISVSWGYAAQLYPSLVPAHILETPLQTFSTWRSWSQGPFTFNTRRVTDPCEQPVIYFLDEVKERSEGETTMSSYGRAQAQSGKACERPDYAPVMAIQRIKVSALKMNPQDWKKVLSLSLPLLL